MIKLKDLLLEDKQQFDYGCVMLYVSLPQIKNLQRQISVNDLCLESGNNGIEDEPHVTILYGLHSNKISDADVISVTKQNIPKEIKLHTISLFKSDKHEVLKLTAESNELNLSNSKLSSTFPNTNTFPEYKPHLTIAYLIPGTGEKYVSKFKTFNCVVNPLYLVYSKPNGSKIKEVIR